MLSEIYYIFLISNFHTIIVAVQNTMPNLTNMYQNVESENQDSFSSSRKTSSRHVRKLEKTTVQSIESKNDEKIHEENPYGDFYVKDETLSEIAVSNFEKIIEEKSKNDDDGFKKEYAVRIKRVIIDIC